MRLLSYLALWYAYYVCVYPFILTYYICSLSYNPLFYASSWHTYCPCTSMVLIGCTSYLSMFLLSICCLCSNWHTSPVIHMLAICYCHKLLISCWLLRLNYPMFVSWLPHIYIYRLTTLLAWFSLILIPLACLMLHIPIYILLLFHFELIWWVKLSCVNGEDFSINFLLSTWRRVSLFRKRKNRYCVPSFLLCISPIFLSRERLK